MTLTRRAKRRRLDWLGRRAARRLALQLFALSALAPTVSATAASVAAARQQVAERTVAKEQIAHAGALVLLFAAQRVRGDAEAVGPYEHLRPTVELPDGVTYNSWTGLTEGEVYDPADQLSRDWWIANVETVVRVSESGGDYTLAQLQTALNDAATANDVRAVIVDSAARITYGVTLPPKTGDANWTLVACSRWWDGTWVPSETGCVDVDNDAAALFTIQPTLSEVAWRAEGAARDRYALFGARLRRQQTNTNAVSQSSAYFNNPTATSVEELPKEHVFRWCWFDGIWRDGSTYYEHRRGLLADGYQCAVLNCAFTGHAGTGSDPQSILILTGGGRLRVERCVLEAAGENFMTGGGSPNEHFLPRDITFRHCRFTKRQDWNPASSLWNASGPAPIAKNLLEVKTGTHLLAEGCIFRNSWPQGQGGPGLLFKSANQDGAERLHRSEHITVRLCKVQDVATPLTFSFLEFGSTPSSTARLLTEPLRDVDLTANLYIAVDREEIAVPSVISAISFAKGNQSGDTKPAGQRVGGVAIRWSTFASRSTGFHNRLFLCAAFNDMDESVIEDCVFDYPRHSGIMRDDPIATGDGNGLAAMGVVMRRNALPEAPLNLRRLTGGWAAHHPEQFEPAALWSLCTTLPFDNPRPEPEQWFADTTASDYRPHPTAAWLGLGADGRDPGYPHDLLTSALSSVPAAPSLVMEDFA